MYLYDKQEGLFKIHFALMEVSGSILLIAGAFPGAALRLNLCKTFPRDHTEYPTGYLEEVAEL